MDEAARRTYVLQFEIGMSVSSMLDLKTQDMFACIQRKGLWKIQDQPEIIACDFGKVPIHFKRSLLYKSIPSTRPPAYKLKYVSKKETSVMNVGSLHHM